MKIHTTKITGGYMASSAAAPCGVHGFAKSRAGAKSDLIRQVQAEDEMRRVFDGIARVEKLAK